VFKREKDIKTNCKNRKKAYFLFVQAWKVLLKKGFKVWERVGGIYFAINTKCWR